MLTAKAAELSFDSNLLGKEIGLGILDLDVADKGLRFIFDVPPLWGDWELLVPAEVEVLQTQLKQ